MAYTPRPQKEQQDTRALTTPQLEANNAEPSEDREMTLTVLRQQREMCD